MKTPLEQYQAALERGDQAEVLRLANTLDWLAIMPTPKRESARRINFVALPKPGEWDVEGSILARDERCMMAMDGLA
jgi:hypothetical protein